jgi:hypothetical protein
MSHTERSQGFFCMPQPGQFAMCDRQNTSRVLPGRTRMSSAPEISLDKELKSQDTCLEAPPSTLTLCRTLPWSAPWRRGGSTPPDEPRDRWPRRLGHVFRHAAHAARRTPTTRTARSAPAAAAARPLSPTPGPSPRQALGARNISMLIFRVLPVDLPSLAPRLDATTVTGLSMLAHDARLGK